MFFRLSPNASAKGSQGLCMCNSHSHIKNVTDKKLYHDQFFVTSPGYPISWDLPFSFKFGVK